MGGAWTPTVSICREKAPAYGLCRESILVLVVVTSSLYRLCQMRRGWPPAAMRRRSHGEWGRSANEIWVAVGTHCGMCTPRVGKESVVSFRSRRLHGRLRSLSGKYGCCAGAAWFHWGNGLMNTYGTWPRMPDTRHGGLLCERIGTVTVR